MNADNPWGCSTVSHDSLKTSINQGETIVHVGVPLALIKCGYRTFKKITVEP